MSDTDTTTSPVVFSTPDFKLDLLPHAEDGFRVPAEQLAKCLSTRGRDLVRSIPEAEKGRALVRTLGGEQEVHYLTEAGFYRAIGQRQTGRIEDAEIRARVERFQAWVYGEVLPQIRKTGGYSTVPTLPMSEEEIVMHALTIQNRKIAALTAKVEADKPKVEAFDELMEADGTYSFLAASKMLGWGRNVMMRDLRRLGIIQGNNLPYQRYEHHFKVTPGTYKNRKTGETVPTATTTVRPMGLEFLRKKLNGGTEVSA